MALNIQAPFMSLLFVFNGSKSYAEIPAGETGFADIYIDPAKWHYGAMCNGLKLIKAGANPGDSVKIQCVDLDNITGLGAGTVLGEYVDWYVDPGEADEATTEYGDIIPPYFYMRIAYTNTGQSPVKIYANWVLHALGSDGAPITQ